VIDRPHRRYNPLTDEWVLCSPHRLARPWQGQVETVAEQRLPAYDPSCYLCPGNIRANGQRNPPYVATFAFDNDFPALLPDPAPGGGGKPETGPERETAPLLRSEPEGGVCRVICFSPRHDLTLADMDRPAIRRVVDAWAEETAALAGRTDIGYVQLFENKGAIMGCSNPHPHCQVWATRSVPGIPARKLASQSRYFEAHGRDLLGDYLAEELRARERIVCGNEHWTALVPFWAVWPFETIVVPARRVADLPALLSDERDALADVLKRLNARYDNLFRCSFPYSMGWHGRPADGAEHPEWRLHAVYLPPLLRSATIRKFLVGYELTAEPQRDLTAETAAARLREMPEAHYHDAAGP
jgi:UDPglucose--hexose-1-phosphate uridylyltransferase